MQIIIAFILAGFALLFHDDYPFVSGFICAAAVGLTLFDLEIDDDDDDDDGGEPAQALRPKAA